MVEDTTSSTTSTLDVAAAQAEDSIVDGVSDEKWFYFSVLLVLFIGFLQVMREMEKSKKSKLKKLKKMISANEQKEKLRQRDQEILKQIEEIKSQ